MAKTISDLIDELGGLSAVAKELGHKSHTTVQYWRNTGQVPRWRRSELVRLARRKKIALPEELTA